MNKRKVDEYRDIYGQYEGSGFIFGYSKGHLSRSKTVLKEDVDRIDPSKRSSDDTPLFVLCRPCESFMDFKAGSKRILDGYWQCPHCGKLQTWAATRTYWGLFKGFLITLAALSVIMLGLVWIFAQYHLEWAFYIAAFISVICYAPPVISLSIKKMRTRHATDRQKPVINWNGWTPPTA